MDSRQIETETAEARKERREEREEEKLKIVLFSKLEILADNDNVDERRRASRRGDDVGRRGNAYKTKPIYYSLIFCAISFNYFSPRSLPLLLLLLRFDFVFYFPRLESPNAHSFARQLNAMPM